MHNKLRHACNDCLLHHLGVRLWMEFYHSLELHPTNGTTLHLTPEVQEPKLPTGDQSLHLIDVLSRQLNIRHNKTAIFRQHTMCWDAHTADGHT